MHEPPQGGGDSVRPRSRSGIFRDPLVRRMAYLSIGLVLLFLVTLVSALVTGVIGSQGPRTRAEREVVVAGAAVLQGSKDPAVWGEYISALVASGQYGRAKEVIAEGRASVNDSATAEFTLGEARLLSAQGDQKAAIAAADKAQALMTAAHEARLAAGGSKAREATIEGLPDNFYDATLLKAYAYRKLSQWASTVEQFDAYIEHNPGAADILVDRGGAKVEAGDKAGAEEDFRAALRFVPDDEEALAGLKTIGADK